jgi:hypothetical protein
MNRTKYILRGTLLLLIVFMLINLYRATEDNLARIAKFKFETLNKVRTDSLDTEHKFDFLVNEATKFNKQFIEDSPHVRDGFRYLFGAVGLLIAIELGFFITERKRTGE